MVGMAKRQTISFMQAAMMFSSETKAEAWFIEQRWGGRDSIACPECGGTSITRRKSRKPQPFQCNAKECRKDFSVKTGGIMHASNLPLTKWAIAYYLITTNIKGISSYKLANELEITQKSAWHMLHRIRESWNDDNSSFDGPAEVDETYIGGSNKTRHEWKRQHIGGGGPKGKAVVVGIKDRDTNQVKAAHLPDNKGITDNTGQPPMVYSDDSFVYSVLTRAREVVNHSVGEYVRGMAHTNGIESFCPMFKRGDYGYHQMSVKHLQRYVNEFAGRHNMKPLGTGDKMASAVRSGVGKRLTYASLIGPRFTSQPKMV